MYFHEKLNHSYKAPADEEKGLIMKGPSVFKIFVHVGFTFTGGGKKRGNSIKPLLFVDDKL